MFTKHPTVFRHTIRFFLLFLMACVTGCLAQHSGSKKNVTKYQIKGPFSVDVASGVNTKIAFGVSPVPVLEDRRYESRQSFYQSENETGNYSIHLAENSSYRITKNDCSHHPMNDQCLLYVTPSDKWSATKPELIKFVVEFKGKKEDYIVYPGATLLSLNITSHVSFPLEKSNYITVTNTSTRETFYFERAQFYSTQTDNITKYATSSADVNISENTCASYLSPGDNCYFKVKAAQKIYGNLKLDSKANNIAYMGFEPLNIKAQAIDDIPENTALGVSYHFTYLFTNMSSSLTANDLKFINSFPSKDGFKIDSKNSSCLGKEKLEPNESCEWTGTFTALATGSRKEMSSTLQYGENSAVSIKSYTRASTVAITGKIIKDIPVNTDSGTIYQFAYRFTNKGKVLAATGIRFINSFPDSVRIKDDINTCKGITSLAPGKSCFWTGEFKEDKKNVHVGMFSVLSYDQGANTELSSHTYVSEVAIEKTAIEHEKIEKFSAAGGKYLFTYKFTNDNPYLPATNVNIGFDKKSLEDQGFFIKDHENSCLNLPACPSPHGGAYPPGPCLKAKASCIITGEYTASKTVDSKAILSMILKYDEGEDILVDDDTTVKKIAISVESFTPETVLPSNALVGNDYVFGYKFINENDHNLAAVNVGFNYNLIPENDFTLDDNGSKSCLKYIQDPKQPNYLRLEAGDYCVIAGKLHARLDEREKSKPALLNLEMEYNNGQTTPPVTSDVYVTKVDVTAKPFTSENAVPNVVVHGLEYYFNYLFTNDNERVNATDVRFSDLPAPEQGFEIDTETSDCLKTGSPPQLKAQQSCHLAGRFIPVKDTQPIFSYKMNYAEGVPVTENFPVKVTDKINLEIVRDIKYRVHQDIFKNVNYTFKYIITNKNEDMPAKDFTITLEEPTPALFDIRLVNKDQDNNLISNSCLNKDELGANKSCEIEGVIKGKLTENNTRNPFKIIIKYREGDHPDFSKREITESTKVNDLGIDDTKSSEIPDNTKTGKKYYFTYEFTNRDQNVSATNISFHIQTFPADEFKIYENTTERDCYNRKTLGPGETCHWKGEFQAKTDTRLSQPAIKITMNYDQGIAEVSDNTTVRKVVLEKVESESTPVPSPAAAGITYPFSYTFQNTSAYTLSATGLRLEKRLNGDADLLITKNECEDPKERNKILGKDQKCVIEGTFTPKSESGTADMTLNLHYAESSMPVTVGPVDISLSPGFWTIGDSCTRPDEEIRLTHDCTNRKGGYVSRYQVDFSKGFGITFEYFFPGDWVRGGYGIAFVIHDDPAGNTRITQRGKSLNTEGIENGAAILIVAKVKFAGGFIPLPTNYGSTVKLVNTENFDLIKGVDYDLNALYKGEKWYKMRINLGKKCTCPDWVSQDQCMFPLNGVQPTINHSCLTIFTDTEPLFQRQVIDLDVGQYLKGTKGYIDIRSATGYPGTFVDGLHSEHKLRNLKIKGFYGGAGVYADKDNATFQYKKTICTKKADDC